jgi:putative isomerase
MNRTLRAAKWESGMDNAVRFDNSRILKNSERAFSLDQESVDLNAYLYAEKNFLLRKAEVLRRDEECRYFKTEAENLKANIQNQFFDPETAWFYDTAIDGSSFIKVMGCEGWIPLWAATQEQTEAVKNTMMDPQHFNTHVPFQTLIACHPDFQPDGGYWRGPVWLDQAFFGTKALVNYGYHQEAFEAARKLIHNAEGVLAKGPSIRENYHPLTGEGLEAENFSWSAVHYILLLLSRFE